MTRFAAFIANLRSTSVCCFVNEARSFLLYNDHLSIQSEPIELLDYLLYFFWLLYLNEGVRVSSCDASSDFNRSNLAFRFEKFPNLAC